MKLVNYFFVITLLVLFFWACGSSPIKKESKPKEEPVVIANDSLEYEVIIIDPGYNLYLNSVAQPRGYYTQGYLENRNKMFVVNWNIRAQSPTRFNPNIYQNVIDYSPSINYGYEVNYLLFNYFLFAQRKYKMDLGVGLRGRIR